MFVLTSPTPVIHPYFIPVVAGFVLCLSLLMVSNLPYRSFKDVNLRKQWPATTVFIIALVFSAIRSVPHVLSVLCAIYILSAPVTVLASKLRRKPTTPELQLETEVVTEVADGEQAPDR
jgi:CDP-diacylglycerol--serine O-phosphatidyltransferase